MTVADVILWGQRIGVVSMDSEEEFARFEFTKDFVKKGVEVAPLVMPLKEGFTYVFKDLKKHTFHGLPGLLSDSLPDKFGNKLIDVWLASTGKQPKNFNAVDRLCYTGKRGMGALEFEPSVRTDIGQEKKLEIQNLVVLASQVLSNRSKLDVNFKNSDSSGAILDILNVGTSAGGARAKAVIAYNEKSKEVRSGQLELRKGFEHWIIKFDGVENNGDWGVVDPKGYGILEYSYYLMAHKCGISMMESRLFEEGGRSHFMTKRFDRDMNGNKYFMQTLGALAHYDYYDSGAHSYEQVIMIMRELNISQQEIEQQVRRIIFNIVGCNRDDHVKNISFMMDSDGKWFLSPAYDLCHSEGSEFTKYHQLSLNGKVADFDFNDLKHLEEYAHLPRGKVKTILNEVIEAFSDWRKLAIDLKIPENIISHVTRTLNLHWY